MRCVLRWPRGDEGKWLGYIVHDEVRYRTYLVSRELAVDPLVDVSELLQQRFCQDERGAPA